MKKDIPEVEIVKSEYKSIENYSKEFYKQDIHEFRIVSAILLIIAIIIFSIS